MTLTSAIHRIPDPPFIGPQSRNGPGSKYRATSNTALASIAFSVDEVRLFPFFVADPGGYDLQRFWMQNGATTGTDLVQMAVYTVDGSGTMDCTVSSTRAISAGTANGIEYRSCAVAAHAITSGNSDVDGTTFVTASVTLKARPGVMYALAFANTASAASGVATTSGAVTFTSRESVAYNTAARRVSMWTAVPTADVTDTITMTFGSTQTACAWSLVAFTNVDTTTNHGVVQTANGTGSSTTPLATLAAFGSANNATFGVNSNATDATTTPGAGFSEVHDVASTVPVITCQTQWQSGNDTTSDATITSAAWGAIAAEIKSLGTTRLLAPGRYYCGIQSSGNTATNFGRNSAPNVSHLGVFTMTGTPAGIPFTPVPVSGAHIINHGITSRATP